MKDVVIIGAGPAGITAGFELIGSKKKYNVTIIEAENTLGGLAKTIMHAENRMDIGGHRFFSKSKKVNRWWLKILPLQSKQAFDYYKTERMISLPDKGPNPYTTDKVMLKRQRISRIFYKQKFFDYPLKLNLKTIFRLGLINTFLCGLSYLKALMKPLPETSLENFYINHFGKRLYKIFFEKYTEKVWGKHPSELSADWGSQRIKGVSIKTLLKNIFNKKSVKETSLIEEFYYPKFGPGQLWETAAKKFVSNGGTIIKNARVVELRFEEGKIAYVGYKINGKLHFSKADYVLSSMPIKDLITAFNIEVPEEIRQIARDLQYRDFVAIGMMVKRLKIKNDTNIKTYYETVPDNWIYIQDDNVKFGRLQIFNNWSPYLLKRSRYKNIWLGLEYFCSETDDYWKLNKQQWRQVAVADLLKAGIINSKRDVVTYCVKKVLKAYPAYYGSYDKIDKLRDYLNGIENLYCIGRNGQHRYNNMDHSMLTAFAAVDHINGKLENKAKIWDINTEKRYHEKK